MESPLLSRIQYSFVYSVVHVTQWREGEWLSVSSPSQVDHCKFWEEWVGLWEGLSADLRDLFNCMFVLIASLQCTCTLRETGRHP